MTISPLNNPWATITPQRAPAMVVTLPPAFSSLYAAEMDAQVRLLRKLRAVASPMGLG
jgi:hypothetical protein